MGICRSLIFFHVLHDAGLLQSICISRGLGSASCDSVLSLPSIIHFQQGFHTCDNETENLNNQLTYPVAMDIVGVENKLELNC